MQNNGELEDMWDKFLETWPIKRLEQMTLEEYSTIGDKNCFSKFVEFKTKAIATISGGSNFTTGIYNQSVSGNKQTDKTRFYVGEYAWLSKYGKDAGQAFKKIKGLMVQIAVCSKEGRFKEIDNIDLGNAYKWKIAFLYQDRTSPSIVNVF